MIKQMWSWNEHYVGLIIILYLSVICTYCRAHVLVQGLYSLPNTTPANFGNSEEQLPSQVQDHAYNYALYLYIVYFMIWNLLVLCE